jgi:N-sulfoglucosamine sulfohydrolase
MAGEKMPDFGGCHILKRRAFLKKCAAGAGWLMACGIDKQPLAASNKRPNIILMVSDDHGLDAVGCYGNHVIHTPNLDHLAQEGVRFDHAFCTTASCSPSRSVLLTGLHNHANGMYGLQHEFHHFQSFDHVKSLPVLLAQSGYRTARIGKFHLAPETVFNFGTVLSAGAANDNASIGRSPVEMVRQCRDFIGAAEDQPFFLYLGFDDPHRGLPFQTWPGPNPFGNKPEGVPGVRTIRYKPEEVSVPSFLPDTPECRAELAEYYQSVSRLDQGIGEMMRIVQESDRADDTVIIYLSDNGIAFPGAKTTVYEPGIRLPLIIRTPWQKNCGIRCSAMISWTDITPTILDMAGALPSNASFHGRSFNSIMEQENPAGWDEVYASHTFHEVTMYYPMRAIRERRYKLIHNLAACQEFPLAMDLKLSSTWLSVINRGQQRYGKRSLATFLQRPEFELYDLLTDPYEVDNLALHKDHEDVFIRLKQKLAVFCKNTNDPWTLRI